MIHDDYDELLTRRELASHLRVAHATLRQLLQKPAQKILADAERRVGRQIVYPRAAVTRYLATAVAK